MGMKSGAKEESRACLRPGGWRAHWQGCIRQSYGERKSQASDT